MSLVVPGDSIRVSNSLYGPGIYQSALSDPRPCRSGILQVQEKGNKQQITYVDSNSRRYIPAAKDLVIGVVVGKYGEGYRIALQDHSAAVRLDQFAFENASKKNKPNLSIRALVYGRITIADKDIEAEMECVDATTGKSGGFGELKGGYVFQLSLGYARSLLFNGGTVLSVIGELVPFEIAIGMNGKIWIDAADTKTIWKICKAIQASEYMPPSEVKAFVSKTLTAN